MGNVIIIAILAVIVIFAIRGTIKHSKGEGGCCGGGGTAIAEHKELDGNVVKQKMIQIEGMHCENCKNSIERSINKIEGAAADVNLKKKQCIVSMDREISDEELRIAVERLDFKVLEIKEL
ncbi:MAG: heavy-metal-associated domain-containing protein [Lachnospiraceae bacterium]|nr:heavy-metal-associated domain-containing protein [Lachnospiraceae bacterium]